MTSFLRSAFVIVLLAGVAAAQSFSPPLNYNTCDVPDGRAIADVNHGVR